MLSWPRGIAIGVSEGVLAFNENVRSDPPTKRDFGAPLIWRPFNMTSIRTIRFVVQNLAKPACEPEARCRFPPPLQVPTQRSEIAPLERLILTGNQFG